MEKWKLVKKSDGRKAVEYWISDQGRLKSIFSKSGKVVIRKCCSTKRGYVHCAIGWVH